MRRKPQLNFAVRTSIAPQEKLLSGVKKPPKLFVPECGKMILIF